MKLLNCYLPVFRLGACLNSKSENTEVYEDFRQKCVSCLEQAKKDAEECDVSELERELALFAVVVWLDEIVLCSTKPVAQVWRIELLQRSYFQTSIGGELFFERMSKLEEAHIEARRVFVFCLLNGFRGKYNSEPELDEVIYCQRELCLPGEWQVWPNEASITPIEIQKRPFSTSTINYVGLAVLCIGLTYVTLLVFMFINFY